MKCRLIRDLAATAHTKAPHENGFVKAGTEWDHPNAWCYVNVGAAEPLDEECKARCGMAGWSDERVAEWVNWRKHVYERTDAGVQPEDFEAFDNGEMLGYYPDGSWILGPNASTEDDLCFADDWEEDYE